MCECRKWAESASTAGRCWATTTVIRVISGATTIRSTSLYPDCLTQRSLNSYHCPFCNICRHGKGLGIDSYHCPKCNTCIGTSMYDQHVCMENKLDCDCPICGDYLQTSRKRVVFLCCGHAIHSDCCDEYLHSVRGVRDA